MSSENFISFKLLTKYTLANFSYKHFIKDNKLQMEKQNHIHLGTTTDLEICTSYIMNPRNHNKVNNVTPE